MELFEVLTYGDTIHWKTLKQPTSLEEGEQFSRKTKERLSDPKVRKSIFDNTFAKADDPRFPPEVMGDITQLIIWMYMNGHYSAKVTYSQETLDQLNTLCKTLGVYDRVRAFGSVDEAWKFLEDK